MTTTESDDSHRLCWENIFTQAQTQGPWPAGASQGWANQEWLESSDYY